METVKRPYVKKTAEQKQAIKDQKQASKQRRLDNLTKKIDDGEKRLAVLADKIGAWRERAQALTNKLS